jgi:pyruvoyl-dependent arginine decarboxylase (PvlArgDC)
MDGEKGQVIEAGIGVAYLYKDGRFMGGVAAEDTQDVTGDENCGGLWKQIEKMLHEMLQDYQDCEVHTEYYIKRHEVKKCYGTALVALCFYDYITGGATAQ